MWIECEDGALLNLAHVSQLTIVNRWPEEDDGWWLEAHLGDPEDGASVVVCQGAKEEVHTARDRIMDSIPGLVRFNQLLPV